MPLPPPAPLIEFSYASKAAGDLPDAALLRMAQQAWSRNTRLGITGSLAVADGAFRQIIEGPSDAVLPLVSRILTDPRHEAISIETFRPIEARRFDCWSATGFGPCGDIPIVEAAPAIDPVRAVPRGFPAKVASIRG